MAAITKNDLDNAKLDTAHLAEIATSDEPTAIDRLGHEKRTLAGLSREFPDAMLNAARAAVSADIAVSSGLSAHASRVAAEAARDTAQLSAGVYASTAIGLGATAPGKFFSVPTSSDGHFLNVYLNDAGVAALQRTVQQPRTVSKRSNVIFGLAGNGGKMPWYVDLAGNMWSMGINVTELLPWITPSRTLSMWGDSMTMFLAQTAAFQGAFSGRTVRNFGIGGQTSDQVFARQGALAILITIVGNVIPETMSAVAVVDLNIRPLSTVSDVVARSLSGRLCGVAGTLHRAVDDSYSFTRSSLGPSLVIDVQTPFIPDTAYAHETTTFWPGRNDIYADTPLPVIQGYITRAVQHLKPQDKHFLLMSCMNGSTEYAANMAPTGKVNYPTEAARYQAIVALNLWMKETYPANYVEVRRALIRQYNPALAQDVIDHGRDVVPGSLRMDDIHLAGNGNALVTAIVAAEFKNRGY